MIQKICPDCNATFSYEPPVGFPDKRKYCDACSARRKAEWANKDKLQSPAPVMKTPEQVQGTLGKHDIVISRNEKPHSYEFGKANNRHKVYYADVNELVEHMRILKANGLIEDENQIPFQG